MSKFADNIQPASQNISLNFFIPLIQLRSLQTILKTAKVTWLTVVKRLFQDLDHCSYLAPKN